MMSLIVNYLFDEDLFNITSQTVNTSTDFHLLFTNNPTFNTLTTEVVPCTSRQNDRVKDTSLVTIKALLMVLIMLAAILGNLLVIVSVLRFERLRLIANSFIVSLALTDLLVACFVMPFSASKELADRWLYGQVVCDVFNANDVLFSTASLLHLCCISVDRYVAVTDPLRYEERLTRRRVGGMLGAVWVLSTVISHLPVHTGWYTTEAQRCILRSTTGDTQCNFEVNQYYGVISSTISFWIPALVMVFTYQKIYHEATRQEKHIQSMTALSSRETSTDRLQYQYVDEAVQRTPPRNHYLGPSVERNLDCSGSVGRNIVERKPNFGSVDRNIGAAVELSPSRNIRHSVAGSLDRILDRNLNRTSCDGKTNVNPDRRMSFDRQTNRNLNRSLDGGLDRDLAPSLDRICLERKLYQNLIHTSYDRQLERSACQHHRRKMRREHKAAKTLGVIMGAFLFCWLPFFTMYLTKALCGDAVDVPHSVESTLFWVGYLNSALNPIIYALLNRDFRDAFRRLLCCRVRRRNDLTKTVVTSAECRKTVTASQDRISMR